ncbi:MULTISPECIES: GGDEF domain-containing protein [Rhizobium]|uniref:diguanylate cyclase n=1 Tax=Rhizobium rhododendri TaxID=2506430 RepID=A0ABY8IQP6_9HYPH|nr:MULTISPECIES: GGDEF domain-containing protein [Rhizobium]MBO9099551.1 GGDEF domain-containing protein [Rhizobium sp. L58/93]MBO9135091.1 GGDEF domain-containing protein [Rhizobium sp. B209b/85]MBO9170963.1 GGDEF domain-containing protein [Rhizobium sp. L245/93]MBO9186864.1 GGDEF domain-containing protein [Rhizobium sp. E27B/91]QXZ80995.1 GGDEF domain-containing protein [Rhizobium sp. L51/94]
MKLDWTPTGWTRVIAGTISITLACVGISVFVDSFNFVNLTDEAINRSLVVDILLPVCLAGPLLFLLLRKVQQLAISHRELTITASTDSLTAVLNRGAFTLLVESYLARAEEQVTLRSGSLLLIDADHFKAINDTFGHQKGDEALKIISQSIKLCLGPADLVGRVGGEEFGVFLPGAAVTEASKIAERIRSTIRNAQFPAGNDTNPLSVSVGGVTFQRPASYDELFSIADQHLYLAKASGRNRVNIVTG